MSVREESKEDRRKAILAAAERLLRENSEADFSMRALAREAGVSFATPFNLFENKAGILVGLMSDFVAANRESLKKVSRRIGPLETLFRLIEISVEGYTSDPRFVRPLVLALDATKGPERQQARGLGALVWKPALESAAEAGVLDEGRNLGLMARSLHLMFREALSAWAAGDIDAEEFKLQALYGLSVWLLSAVLDDHQKDVAKKRDAFERKLLKIQSR